MTSPSKNSYMGQNLRRLPRSELEDSIMRDLNRHDARLSENLRTVDRARDVVLKNLESDKKNFIRGGINNNKKLVKTTSKSPAETRQSATIASQHHKFLSDMRTRRAYEQMIMSRRPSSEVINSLKPFRSKTDLTDTRSESRRNQHASQEDDLNNETHRSGSVDNGLVSPKGDERSRANRTSNNSPSDNRREPRASTTPTIKIDDYDRISTSPSGEDNTKPGVSERVDGKERDTSSPGGAANTTPEMTKRQSSFVLDRTTQPPSTMPQPFSDDYYFGRRVTFWEYLSTPKNPNMNRQKREQLEMEFALRSQETTVTPKSTKGIRMPPSKPTTTTKTVTTSRAKSATTKRSGTGAMKATNTNKGKQSGNK